MASPFDSPQQRSSEQVAARANLLAGLRTGGRRSGSPATFHQQQQQSQQHATPTARRMKPSAAVFTPTGGQQQQQQQYSPTSEMQGKDYMGNLELQMAALQMSAMQSTPNVAASYGASLGQPQAQALQQRQSDANEHMLRVQQQQQLFQQQQALQQQLDALRHQSQVQQQNQAADQQRALFAQIQAEYDSRVSQSQQVQQLQQRQAAQEAIQTNLRNRQITQIYAQLLEEDEQGLLDRRMLNGRDLWQVAVDYVTNEHAEAHQAACQEQERLQQYYTHLQQLQQQTQEALENQRALSEAANAGQGRAANVAQRAQNNTAPVRSGQADKAANWRSRASVGPAIVVEDNSDSDSRKSSPRSSRSFNSADETPQTSEEDVDATTPPSVAAAINKLSAAKTATHNRRESWTPTGSTGTGSPAQYAPKSLPRAVALSVAPRPRRSTEATQANAMLQASRQPRGPPTEFHELNFASRKKAQLRKEALNKLRACSSPRVSNAASVAAAV